MSTSSAPSFQENALGYLSSPLSSAVPYTASEYFTVLLGRATQAAKDGDYGISAALVLRYPDVELITLARNTVISTRDPLGHAETNAIRQFRDFLSLPPTAWAGNAHPWTDAVSVAESSDNIFVRPAAAGSSAREAVLYTTLEPCPMCTVAILNSRIGKVVIAAPDEAAGALAPQRLTCLPVVWPKIATSQQIRVRFASRHDESDLDTYVPGPLSDLLERAFLETREACDARLENGILFKPGMHSELAALLAASSKIPD